MASTPPCISIHAPLTGCDAASRPRYLAAPEISIHAPLTGCDANVFHRLLPIYISIHAPLTGCDRSKNLTDNLRNGFQSTHPSRGATKIPYGILFPDKFQSTHPSRGATRFSAPKAAVSSISIHAPLTGCDGVKSIYRLVSTSISIHAPLTGCDLEIQRPVKMPLYFNPRTPHGVRRESAKRVASSIRNFNPRTPHGVRRQKLPL